MEKSVMHVRQHLGKVDRKGTDKRMEVACHKIPQQQTGSQVRAELRGREEGGETADNSRRRVLWLHPKSPLLKAFHLIHEVQTLWDYEKGPTLRVDDNGNRVHKYDGRKS